MSNATRWLMAPAGGIVLGLAAPPAVVPFAEWLVLLGLAIWFALATRPFRPLLSSYLFGCAYMAWFSWSVHHVLLPAYLAIVFLGGGYFVLGSAAVRGVPARFRALAFGVAVAGSFWLRAIMPEIYYPHGQPCHCLFEWPALMRIVTVGGEPLMNALLGLLAATGFQLWQSWRSAVVVWRVAVRGFCCAVTLTAGCALWGYYLALGVAAPMTKSESYVKVAAIEPGFHPEEIWTQPQRDQGDTYRRLVRERLLVPTRTVLGGDQVPDLILWPESSLLEPVRSDEVEAGSAELLRGEFPSAPASTRLLLGANVSTEQASTPAALLVDLASGRVLEYQGKRWLVPGGEFLPLVGLLPKDMADSLRRTFQEALGTPADCVPGVERPPMKTAAGVPFGALLCYDNGFYEPAAAQVAQGAQFLVVLSNEAWYRGGGELAQLVAMTVVRALESCVPIVRCTLDGHSVAVDANGRIRDGLSLAPAPQPTARVLQVNVRPRAGGVPPMAWLRGWSGPILGLLMAFAVVCGAWRLGRR